MTEATALLNEQTGRLAICVQHIPGVALRRSVIFELNFEGVTAVPGADFDDTPLSFAFDSATSLVCEDVDIELDGIVESTETFDGVLDLSSIPQDDIVIVNVTVNVSIDDSPSDGRPTHFYSFASTIIYDGKCIRIQYTLILGIDSYSSVLHKN